MPLLAGSTFDPAPLLRPSSSCVLEYELASSAVVQEVMIHIPLSSDRIRVFLHGYHVLAKVEPEGVDPV